MKAAITASVSFEAGHTDTRDSFCNVSGHGHRWVVAVTVQGDNVDQGDLLSSLRSVIDEFAGRNLNDMLPGVRANPGGLGVYIHERLVLEWRWITQVRVDMGPNVSVLLEWELR